MKKILAFMLVAIMALPFGVMASAAEVPEEPVASAETTITLGAAKDNANPNFPDVTPSKVGTKAKLWQDLFTGSLKNGGNFVIVGKGALTEDATLAATKAPVVFTSVKDGVNYASFNEDGSYNTVDGKGAVGGGQYGSIMLTGNKTLTFKGEAIFDNVVVFNRDTKLATIKVMGKLVVKNNVTFAEKNEGKGYTLDVAEGGVAFLHQLGFINYTGTGTIVIGDEIKNTVTPENFGGFGGKVIYTDGTEMTGIPAEDTGANIGGNTGNNNQSATTEKVDNGEVTPRPSKPLGGGSAETEAESGAVDTAAPETTATTDTADNNNGGSSNVLICVLCAVGGAVVGAAVTFVITKKKK